MNKKYFIDSCLWMDYFKLNRYTIDSVIINLLKSDSIYINGIVITELLAGTKRKETSITANIDLLNICEMNYDYFIRAGQMIKKMKGKTIPLSDVYIAVHCLDNDLILLSNDKHFDMIKEFYPLFQYKKTVSVKCSD
jgi:predicted nucleic acid-binding protein